MANVSPLTVVLCLIEDEGRILLLCRNKPPYKGYLALPGGKLHAGETVEQAACREAFEETGLHTVSCGVMPVLTESIRTESAHHDAAAAASAATIEAHFILFPVWMQVTGGQLQASPEGELCWLPLQDLGGSANATTQQIVQTDLVLIRALCQELKQKKRMHSVCHMDVERRGESFVLQNPEDYGQAF